MSIVTDRMNSIGYELTRATGGRTDFLKSVPVDPVDPPVAPNLTGWPVADPISRPL